MSGDPGDAAHGRYLTIARDAGAQIEERRSRFRCRLVRVEDEAAARLVVEEERRVHWDARHHCSAFVLGARADLQRSSDDGEPAGTAGAPMLEALRGAGVSDVAAVVTRWFGGVLLGTGGLVRAYGEAVRAALAEAGTLVRERRREVAVDLDHAVAGRVESALRARGIAVLDVTYAGTATLVVGVPVGEEAQLAAVLAELTAGAATPRLVGERWVDLPAASGA